MYNEELDMALESAYDDGYVQALIDMGVDPDEIADDIAVEDVDMFDDNYFDEAMEGPAREYRHRQNEGKTRGEISYERFLNKDVRNRDSFNPNDYDYSKTLTGMYTPKEGRRLVREVNAKYNRGPKTSNMPERYEKFRNRYDHLHKEVLGIGMADSSRNVAHADEKTRRAHQYNLTKALHDKQTQVKRMNPEGKIRFEKK